MSNLVIWALHHGTFIQRKKKNVKIKFRHSFKTPYLTLFKLPLLKKMSPFFSQQHQHSTVTTS